MMTVGKLVRRLKSSPIELAVVLLVAGLAVFVGIRVSAEPEFFPPHCCGAAFTLYVGQSVSSGAKVANFLAQPRRIVLVVEQYPAGFDPTAAYPAVTATVTSLQGYIPPAPQLVGYVPLGQLSAGASFTPWDFTVNGQALLPGNYRVEAEAATDSDLPNGQFPPAPYVLTIGADGTVSANLMNLSPQAWVVNTDGTLSPSP